MRKPQAGVACGFRLLARPAGRREKQDAPGNRDQLELGVLIVVAHVVHSAMAVLAEVPMRPALTVTLTVALAIALVILTEVAATPARTVLAVLAALAVLTKVP